MLVYSSNSPKKKNAPQKIYIHPTIAVKLKFKKIYKYTQTTKTATTYTKKVIIIIIMKKY